MHIQTHTHAHTDTHTHSCTYIQTHTLTRQTCLTYSLIGCAHAHTDTHSCTHTDTHTLMQIQTRTLTRHTCLTFSLTWLCSCTYRHTQTHAHTQTHTHSCTYRHTHSHARPALHSHSLGSAHGVQSSLASGWNFVIIQNKLSTCIPPTWLSLWCPGRPHQQTWLCSLHALTHKTQPTPDLHYINTHLALLMVSRAALRADFFAQCSESHPPAWKHKSGHSVSIAGRCTEMSLLGNKRNFMGRQML